MATETQADVLTDAIAAVEDGSTVSDLAKLRKITDGITDAVKGVLQATRGLTTRRKTLAEARVLARSLILLPNGHPDWAASSESYRVTVGAAESEVWATATAEEKRSNDAAIRQLVGRIYLEPILTDHVLRSINLSDEERKSLKWQEVAPGHAVLVGDIPKVVKTALGAEYKSADLTVPEKFGGPAKGSGAGPGKDKEDASPEQAMGNVAQRVENAGKDGGPSWESVISGLMRVTCSAGVSMAASGEVKDRPKIAEQAQTFAEAASIFAKIAAAEQSAEDLERLAEIAPAPVKK